jgi:hypothetical protein
METFIGFLEEGYKVKMSDGSEHELKVSEIPLGTRIWITYETKRQDSGGQKVKINVITHIGFFPKDKYVQLRERLNLPASTPITDSQKRALPGGDPLKMYVAIEDSRVNKFFMEWVAGWNKEEAKKYGAIEVAADPASADVCLLRLRTVREGLLPLSQAAMFLAVRKADGIEVLWQREVVTDVDFFYGKGQVDENEVARAGSHSLETEIERRMKQRGRLDKR